MLLLSLLSLVTTSLACLSSGVPSASCGCSSCPCGSAPSYSPPRHYIPPPPPPVSFHHDSAPYGYQQHQQQPVPLQLPSAGYSVISPASSYLPYSHNDGAQMPASYLPTRQEEVVEMPYIAPPIAQPPPSNMFPVVPIGTGAAPATLNQLTADLYKEGTANNYVETTTKAQATYAPPATPTGAPYMLPKMRSVDTAEKPADPFVDKKIPIQSSKYGQIEVPSSDVKAETDEYLAVLKDEQAKQKPQFVTYYNQECAGSVLGRSRGETILSATNKCSLLGCVAANAIPDGKGTYQIDFLKEVHGRVNKAGNYCMSLNTVPLRSARKTRQHKMDLKIKALKSTEIRLPEVSDAMYRQL